MQQLISLAVSCGLALLMAATVSGATAEATAASGAAASGSAEATTASDSPAEAEAATASAAQAEAAAWGKLAILGYTVEPGSKHTFPFIEKNSFDTAFLNTIVQVVHGSEAGPALCVTAGIHGDEINGAEIARRVFVGLDASKLHGTVIIMPMINIAGIRSGERYMPDRRDLNRAFPGANDGSVAAVVAAAAFGLVTQHCQSLIDLHTGSFDRVNAPQIRVGSGNQTALDMARHFGSGIVLLGDGPKGSLRREASDAGIASIIYEAGGPHRFDTADATVGAQGVFSVMAWLHMIAAESKTIPFSQLYERTYWERVPLGAGGFFFPEVELGATVKPGDRLGVVYSPGSNRETAVVAQTRGTVIGMSAPQIVLSGYAVFHIGLTGQDETLTPEDSDPAGDG